MMKRVALVALALAALLAVAGTASAGVVSRGGGYYMIQGGCIPGQSERALVVTGFGCTHNGGYSAY